eukprot:scaffold10975_cov102-Attheya_sp.AAC.1
MVRPLTQVMPDEQLSDQCMYGGSPMEWLGTWDLNRTGGTTLVILPGSEDMGSSNTARRKSVAFASRRTITTSETDVEALVPVEELRVSGSGRSTWRNSVLSKSSMMMSAGPAASASSQRRASQVSFTRSSMATSRLRSGSSVLSGSLGSSGQQSLKKSMLLAILEEED